MKISGKRDYMVSLESVAMTDIVLNLFIFFFISFSLLYTINPWKKLEVKLPKAEHASAIKDQQQINITITSDGPVYLDGKMVTMKELKGKVYSRYKTNPEISVLLCADKRRSFREVVSVLDVLSGIGITRLDIAAAEQE
ncbi:MAG: biopolymer transporter ExbD [Candidatus Omnitrophica bacterium]|nr:biopolymer transporter ExbD [Candidatus Omnitrophota bacterium]MCG2708373.1 biopolymer transporter ExbD [Candidatus Omnitrophota bacterium]